MLRGQELNNEESMSRRLAVYLLLAGAMGLSYAALAASADSSDPRLQKAYKFQQGGWTYVHLEGTPSDLGYQHGSLLAAEIGDAFEAIRLFDTHQSGRDWEFFRKTAREMLWPHIDVEYQQELQGIADGVKANGVNLDVWDIVALNAFEEVPDYYLPWLAKQQKTAKNPNLKAPGNCSAFIATGNMTKDHQIVIAHNNWTSYLAGSRWVIIFDIQPDRGNRILMDGFPGVITSDDDFGVTSAGMLITETTITQFEGWDPKGKPEFVRARKAMQYGRSIDEFVKIMLDGNNGGYANDWLVGDNKTGEIALFELGLKNHSVRRTNDGYYVGSSFPVDEKLARLETNFDFSNKGGSPLARKARWESLVEKFKGEITVETVKAMEGDTYDAFEKKEGPNERSLCGVVERSPRGIPEWDWGRFFPGGTVQ